MNLALTLSVSPHHRDQHSPSFEFHRQPSTSARHEKFDISPLRNKKEKQNSSLFPSQHSLVLLRERVNIETTQLHK